METVYLIIGLLLIVSIMTSVVLWRLYTKAMNGLIDVSTKLDTIITRADRLIESENKCEYPDMQLGIEITNQLYDHHRNNTQPEPGSLIYRWLKGEDIFIDEIQEAKKKRNKSDNNQKETS